MLNSLPPNTIPRNVRQPALFRNILNLPSIQTIHLIRHGETEMNVRLRDCNPSFGEPGFVDPMLFDTRLTERGQQQAKKLQRVTQDLQPSPELLVVSPLTRALDTALHAFPPDRHEELPRVVHPLARERCYMSSDMGRPMQELQPEYPKHDWSVMETFHEPHDVWWGPMDDAGSLESHDELLYRAEGLRQWLEKRPERCLALVTHWAVLQALTGSDFRNCEMQQWRTDRLKSRPWLMQQRKNNADVAQKTSTAQV